MKPLAEWLDLIQGKSIEEFTAEYRHPVLIGLGQLAGEMQKNPAKAAGTMFLNLGASPGGGGADPMVNQVFTVQKVSPETPADGIYIGAGTENDIPIPDSSVSKSHAHIILHPEGIALVDHGSTNGTFVNGSRVEPKGQTPLAGGDILTIGRFSFTFYDAVSFAKLLAVQAMARGRSRSRPRTPGGAKLNTLTPGRSTIPPGAQPAISRSRAPMAPVEPPWPTPGAAPGRPVSGRSATSGSWSPVSRTDGDWQQRAVGRSGSQNLAQGQRLAPAQQQAPPNLPVQKEPTTFFARWILKLANWLRRIAGA